MIAESHNGTKVSVMLLRDRWLFLCVPILFFNALVFLVDQIFLRHYFALVKAVAVRVLWRLGARSLVNIPVLLFLCVATTAGVYLADGHSAFPKALVWLMMGAAVLLGMMVIACIEYTSENRYGVRADLVLGFTQLTAKPPEGVAPVPKGLRVAELSWGIFLGSLMVTIYVLCNVVLLVLSTPFSLPFWLAVNALIMVLFLVDFVVVEHVASHSPKGLVVTLEKPGLMARSLYCLEWVRRFIVWPLYFWLPNAYYLTHTHHHHVENNGPADWQSTLRFDQSSLMDFTKSLSALQFSMLFPLDTLRYFKAMNKKRMQKMLVQTCIQGYGVILLAIIIEPYLAIVPMLFYFGRGWVIHQFIFAWHGFHDARQPYDVVASNNDEAHYVHHKKPGLHIFSPDIYSIVDENRADKTKQFPVHIDKASYTLVMNNWLLIQSLLWQRKFTFIRNIIECGHLSDSQLSQLVCGTQLLARREKLASVDRRLSAYAGRLIEWMAKKTAPVQYQRFITPR